MTSKRDLLRKEQNLSSNTNPAKKYYKWESDNKVFSYYDKEKEENILVKLPFKFVTLGRPLITVKGFDQKIEKWMYSNEVQSVNDELIVKYFDKNLDEIARGKWNDIKEKVDSKGGKYHLSIYGYDLETKEIINISIKGLGVGEWFTLQKDWGQRLADEIVCVKSYKDGLKGKTKFTYPSFTLERSISDDELDLVLDSLTELKNYLKEYLENKGQNLKEIEEEPTEEPIEEDIEF